MNRRVWIIAVALAVLAAGMVAVSACHRHRSPSERADYLVDKVAKDLELNEAQRVKLDAVKQEALKAWAEIRNERRAALDEVIAEVEHDRLDQAKLLALFARHQDLQSRLAPGVAAAAAEFHASLTAEQKTLALEHLRHFRERMQHRGHGARM